MTENERIRELRKELSLTMEEFGKRIGVSKQTISNIENKNRNATEHILKSICREFSVREEWLRTGEGNPFIEKTKDEQIQEMVNEIMAQKPEDFRRRFVRALTVLDADGWKALEKFIDAINEERKAAAGASHTDREMSREDFMAEAGRQWDEKHGKPTPGSDTSIAN